MLKFLCWIASACKQRKPRNDRLTEETELLPVIEGLFQFSGEADQDDSLLS